MAKTIETLGQEVEEIEQTVEANARKLDKVLLNQAAQTDLLNQILAQVTPLQTPSLIFKVGVPTEQSL